IEKLSLKRHDELIKQKENNIKTMSDLKSACEHGDENKIDEHLRKLREYEQCEFDNRVQLLNEFDKLLIPSQRARFLLFAAEKQHGKDQSIGHLLDS
ncbi:unnamed protein product, partial [Didymodactylos carnosus]